VLVLVLALELGLLGGCKQRVVALPQSARLAGTLHAHMVHLLVN
jgi:hypothetical protein